MNLKEKFSLVKTDLLTLADVAEIFDIELTALPGTLGIDISSIGVAGDWDLFVNIIGVDLSEERLIEPEILSSKVTRKKY